MRRLALTIALALLATSCTTPRNCAVKPGLLFTCDNLPIERCAVANRPDGARLTLECETP